MIPKSVLPLATVHKCTQNRWTIGIVSNIKDKLPLQTSMQAYSLLLFLKSMHFFMTEQTFNEERREN